MASQSMRASPMEADERRKAIIEATIPLLVEHGLAVLSKQIACAADVAEGTVFRVFTDKAELLYECVVEALRTDAMCVRIRKIPAGPPLVERLATAGTLISEQVNKLGQLLHALASSGYDVRRHQGDADAENGPLHFMTEVIAAVAALLDTEAGRLRLPSDVLARLFIGLLMSSRFDPDQDNQEVHVRRSADILLYGAFTG